MTKKRRVTLEEWNGLRLGYCLRPLGELGNLRSCGPPPDKSQKQEIAAAPKIASPSPPLGLQIGTVHRVKPDGGGQISAPGLPRLHFIADQVLLTAGGERLSRSDTVEFRVVVSNDKWEAVDVFFLKGTVKAPEQPALSQLADIHAIPPGLGYGGRGEFDSSAETTLDLGMRGHSNLPAWMSEGGGGGEQPAVQQAEKPSEQPNGAALGDFIPSNEWKGPMLGFTFKSGPKGMGYYADNNGAAIARHFPVPPTGEPDTATPVDTATTVDPQEALGKISKALAHPKKAAKGCQLLLRLINVQLNSSTAPLFVNALINAFVVTKTTDDTTGGGKVLSLSLNAASVSEEIKEAYRSVFAALAKREGEVFSQPTSDPGVAERCSDVISMLSLGIGARGALTSDDTYVYCAGMKEVRDNILSLPMLNSDHSQSDWAALRRCCLLDCLKTSWEKKTWSWAKAEIESTYAMAAERRLRFPQASDIGGDDERERLDKLTTQMRDQQRKVIVNRAVRANNSTAHPLRNKGFDAVR